MTSPVAITDAARRSTSLYSLSADYLEILDLLEDADADAEGFAVYLSGKVTPEEARSRANMSAETQAATERLRAYLLRNLQSVDTPRFRISVRTNPPSVAVLEQMLVPAEYLRTVTTTTVDKRAVLEALKTTGEVVPGVEITRTQRLEIR